MASPSDTTSRPDANKQVMIVENCYDDTINLVERNPAPGGFPLVDPDRSGKKSQFDLVELAHNIQTADKFTRAVAGSKLATIAEQVRFLQEQAKKVLEDAAVSKRLHHIACNFKKIPGKTYYIYRKENGKEFLSMISPEEWGTTAPEFVTGYRLEHDMSWTPLEEVQQRSDQEAMIDKILKAGSQLQLTFN